MMFRLGLLIGLLMCVQEAAAVPQWAFRISFTDKTGSPALANPSAFLSPRALSRRTSQGVTVTDADRPVSPAYADSVLRITSGKMHCTSRWFNNCVILVDDSSKIALLQGKPFVSRVEYVGYFSTGLHMTVPQVPVTETPSGAAEKGTGSSAYYGSSWAQTTMVNGDYLHDNGYWGQGQLIAVIDLGFLGTDTHRGFDSLRARNGIIDQYNFVNANTNVYSRSSHGTASLSTMAGLIPNSYVGTAPRANYALYIVDDVDYTDALYELDNVISAMERADSIGADVISGSVGYNEFVNPVNFTFAKSDLNGHTTNVAIAANMAVQRGIFVSVSAGNEGGNSWNFLLTPGDADSVMTIGSVNSTRIASGFSSPGPNAAGRIKPDVCLQGEPVAVFTAGNTISNSSGTSFATPQLSGWAACLRSFRADLRPFLLRDAISRSADRYTAPQAQYGYGIPDFKKVLQSLDVTTPSQDPHLEVSPNPFNREVSLSLRLTVPVTVSCKLYDINGALVAEKDFGRLSGKTEVQLEVASGLPAGTYLLQTTVGNQSFTNKLTRH